MAQGCMSVVALIDGCSRYVLAWQLSTTMAPTCCLVALELALVPGEPMIFNTDPGVQCTRLALTGRLARAGIAISLEGRGRALDHIFVERLWRSVTYEDIDLND